MPGFLRGHAHARPPCRQRVARLFCGDAPRDAHLDGLLGVRPHLLAGLAEPGLCPGGHDRHHVLERLARLRGHFQGVLIDLPEQLVVRAVHDLLEIRERIFGADGQLHRNGSRRRLCRAADETPVQIRPLITQRGTAGHIGIHGLLVALCSLHAGRKRAIPRGQLTDPVARARCQSHGFAVGRAGLHELRGELANLLFGTGQLQGQRPGRAAGVLGLGLKSGKAGFGFTEISPERLDRFPLFRQHRSEAVPHVGGGHPGKFTAQCPALRVRGTGHEQPGTFPVLALPEFLHVGAERLMLRAERLIAPGGTNRCGHSFTVIQAGGLGAFS